MTMQRKLDRTIAVLEVEAKMLEAQAEKLSIMARQLADPEHPARNHQIVARRNGEG
jgi:signal recognition particle subunit SEC65